MVWLKIKTIKVNGVVVINIWPLSSSQGTTATALN